MIDQRANAARVLSLRVLLLEDDDADAYLTQRVLMSMSRIGEVVRVRNGQEALKQLQTGELAPDIAFVDLQMPTMSGLDFLDACMNQGLANVPLIVLTSSSDWKDSLRSRVKGAVWVITKPDDPADLKKALQEAIDTFAPNEEGEAGALDRSNNYAGGSVLTRASPSTISGLQPTVQFGRRQKPPGP